MHEKAIDLWIPYQHQVASPLALITSYRMTKHGFNKSTERVPELWLDKHEQELLNNHIKSVIEDAHLQNISNMLNTISVQALQWPFQHGKFNGMFLPVHFVFIGRQKATKRSK
ncbi:hypothetical protein AVEN_202618-1 [Araneus ventricosus]|uniref:Uncharacterized protein n=1 Tax=Araneus ventricosus TaxID=182803 RepID=A0A4Y2W5T5_ARAVE|nr:hypothetical protein AVEN_202618-1 [Araneus ventricosus]